MKSTLEIYRLVPQAPVDDPNWQNSPPQGELVVRARSSGDARIVAAEAEGDFLSTGSKPAEGVSTSHASAFRNEKLYTVVLDETSAHDKKGPRGVLEGTTTNPVLATYRARSGR